MVKLNDLSTYGPLPTDWVLRNSSALSAVLASAASDAPFAFATLLLRIPNEGEVRIARTCGVGVSVLRTTVFASGAETVIPFINDDGLPLTFLRRLSEKTTSAEVTLLPSENLAFGSRVKVNSVAFAFTFHLEARPGTGVEASPPL